YPRNSIYNGMFKVINTSDNEVQKISIVDGFDEDSLTCGRVQVNQFMADVVSEELTITGNAWLYLEAALVGDPVTGATAEVIQYTEEQDYEAGKARALVARVMFADDKITKFSRENVPPVLYIIGAC
ncbi:MAG: hypothetical protein PHV59_00370, partial [Victivallales bacterium]|nr:hypothetical protein [Victivallales bacterium]